MSWLAASNLAIKPLWFLFTTAVCLRVLGEAGYGLFVASLAFAMSVAAFSDWGLADFTVREGARLRTHISGLFSNLIVLRFGLGIGAIVLTLIVGIAFGRTGEALQTLMAAAAYTGALRLLDYVRAFYRAYEILRYEAVSVFTERAATVTLGVVGLWIAPSALGALSGMAIGSGLALSANLIWVNRTLCRFDSTLISGREIRATLISAIPLGIYGFLSIIFLNIGTVILEMVSGTVAAGQYGAAYRFIEVASILPSVVVAAMYPRLATIEKGQNSEFWRLLIRWTVFSSLAATLASLALLFIGSTAMEVLSGGGFLGAASVLRTLTWQIPLMTISSVLGAGLMAADKPNILVLALLLAVPLTVALNLLLVPSLSFHGTALSLVVGQGLTALMFFGRLSYLYATAR